MFYLDGLSIFKNISFSIELYKYSLLHKSCKHKSLVDKPGIDRLNIGGSVKVLLASCCDKMKTKREREAYKSKLKPVEREITYSARHFLSCRRY